MARPSTGHVRSHDAATCCRASLPACKPRRRSRKMAEMAVLGMFFEHLSTGVNGVGNRDINHAPLVVCNPPSSLTSAPSKSGPMTPAMSRHPRFTDSLLIAGIGFVFCPTSGRYWRKSLSAIVLLLWSLASIFAFLVLHSRVCPRLKSCLPRSAELPSVIVPTFGTSRYFGKSIPFAAATAIAHNRCDALSSLRIGCRNDVAAAEAPAGLSFLSRIRVFKEPHAGGDIPPV